MQVSVKDYILQLKKLSIFKKVLLVFSLLTSIVLLTLLVFYLLVYVGAFGKLPKNDTLTSFSNEEASLVYSTNGELIGKYFAKNRTNIGWDEIPEHLRQALIATEDKRFFEHQGIDARSYLRVIFRTLLLRDKSSGGGSTLTQQLIKNLYGRNNKGFLSLPVIKVKEAIVASRLENIFKKEELLLLYFNSVPFGENVYGVESAAQRYFNKTVSELKIEESAVLVGMLKANTFFNPRLNPQNSITRRNLVLSLMAKESYLTPFQADSLKQLPLVLDYENFDLEAPAGYFVFQVKKKTLQILENLKTDTGIEYDLEKDGLRIYTTLNLQIQQMVSLAVKEHLKKMQILLDQQLKNQNTKKLFIQKLKQDSLVSDDDLIPKTMVVFNWDSIVPESKSMADSLWHYHKMLNAAVLITHPKTGEVISWYGGNHFRYLPFDLVLSRRQIASAFKPILYATAFDEGFTPCTYLGNELILYEAFDQWEPQNFDHTSTPDSLVALWYALAHSMNLPSVDLYFKTGAEKLAHTSNKLGFPTLPDHAPSVSLGTLDLSLYKMVRAYATFANQGDFIDLIMIDRITDVNGNELYANENRSTHQVFGKNSCEQITAILQTAINEGTGMRIRNHYGIRADLAGKTGTAQNYSDAWFMANTPDLVLGTWVGARSPEMHFNNANGTGSSLALPIIGQILSTIEKDPLLRQKYLTSFELPDDIYANLDCPPYKAKGVKGFFDRLFKSGKDQKKGNEEKKVKTFFRKLFKKNR